MYQPAPAEPDAGLWPLGLSCSPAPPSSSSRDQLSLHPLPINRGGGEKNCLAGFGENPSARLSED